MNNTNNSNGYSATWYRPLPTINFIIAVNGCANTDNIDSKLLQGKAPAGIVWPGQVTNVLTPAEIDRGFSNRDITIPSLRYVLLDRGYKAEQIDSRKVAIVLFQVYRHGLDSNFSQIWDWAFCEQPTASNDFRKQQRSNVSALKLKRIAYDDLDKFSCPVRAGNRGFLEVSSSTLLLSGSRPSNTINLFSPELIHAGRPTIESGNDANHLVSNVA
ncbi:MAG: hypothetical protein DRQ59_14720 [Gammaproteobacteria bacterium]|nr:MAG: hypothetical protein DRQ59_14720 [Gammaproteobacteria bacterium]